MAGGAGGWLVVIFVQSAILLLCVWSIIVCYIYKYPANTHMRHTHKMRTHKIHAHGGHNQNIGVSAFSVPLLCESRGVAALGCVMGKVQIIPRRGSFSSRSNDTERERDSANVVPEEQRGRLKSRATDLEEWIFRCTM